MPASTAKARPTAMWIASTSGSNTRDTMTVPMSPRWTSHRNRARRTPSRAGAWLVMPSSVALPGAGVVRTRTDMRS